MEREEAPTGFRQRTLGFVITRERKLENLDLRAVLFERLTESTVPPTTTN